MTAGKSLHVPGSRETTFGIDHTLGASGAVEAVITVLALTHQIAPPTLRLHTRAEDFPLDYIPHTPRPMPMTQALSNTFGFGGSNVSLLLRKTTSSLVPQELRSAGIDFRQFLDAQIDLARQRARVTPATPAAARSAR